MKNDFDSLDETSMYDQGDREEITAVLEAADDVYISIDNVSYHVALRGEGHAPHLSPRLRRSR